MNDFDKAAENYTESTKLDDKFVFSHIQLAVALYKSGEVPRSKAMFIRTEAAFPDRSEPPNYLLAELPHSYVALFFLTSYIIVASYFWTRKSSRRP